MRSNIPGTEVTIPSIPSFIVASSSSVASMTAWRKFAAKAMDAVFALRRAKKHLEVGMIFQKPLEDDDIFHKDRSKGW